MSEGKKQTTLKVIAAVLAGVLLLYIYVLGGGSTPDEDQVFECCVTQTVTFGEINISNEKYLRIEGSGVGKFLDIISAPIHREELFKFIKEKENEQ